MQHNTMAANMLGGFIHLPQLPPPDDRIIYWELPDKYFREFPSQSQREHILGTPGDGRPHILLPVLCYDGKVFIECRPPPDIQIAYRMTRGQPPSWPAPRPHPAAVYNPEDIKGFNGTWFRTYPSQGQPERLPTTRGDGEQPIPMQCLIEYGRLYIECLDRARRPAVNVHRPVPMVPDAEVSAGPSIQGNGVEDANGYVHMPAPSRDHDAMTPAIEPLSDVPWQPEAVAANDPVSRSSNAEVVAGEPSHASHGVIMGPFMTPAPSRDRQATAPASEPNLDLLLPSVAGVASESPVRIDEDLLSMFINVDANADQPGDAFHDYATGTVNEAVNEVANENANGDGNTYVDGLRVPTPAPSPDRHAPAPAIAHFPAVLLPEHLVAVAVARPASPALADQTQPDLDQSQEGLLDQGHTDQALRTEMDKLLAALNG